MPENVTLLYSFFAKSSLSKLTSILISSKVSISKMLALVIFLLKLLFSK